MLEDRQRIVEDMEKYMSAEGYQKPGKSKTSHSLDSMIFTYVNTAGISDNIKIEINYSMRVHIFPLSYRQVQTGGILEEFKVLSVEETELFGSKVKALLDRAAPRDLCDVDNMIKYGLFHGRDERNALRKCAVFYMAVGNKETPERVNIEAVDEITWYRIKTDLLPVKRKKGKFDLDEAKQRVGCNFRLKGREDMFADYHVHTEFSDDSVYLMEQVVRDAIAGGMDEICFTDHVDYGVKQDWDCGKPILYRGEEPLANVDYPVYIARIKELVLTPPFYCDHGDKIYFGKHFMQIQD